MDLYTNPVGYTWAPFVWQQLAPPPAFDRKTIAGAAARHFLGRVYLSTVELISIQVTVEVPGICVFSWKAAEEGRLRRQSDPALEDGIFPGRMDPCF